MYGRFDSKSNRTADSIRDSIRMQKNDSQVPTHDSITRHKAASQAAELTGSRDWLNFRDEVIDYEWQRV